MATAFLLACLPLVVAQDGPAPVNCPFDRTVELELAAGAPPLAGHGPSERVEYRSEFSGTLHVWTKVDGGLDTLLQVENGQGKLLAEDDDSGGKPTPYVKLAVEPGVELVIAVATSNPGDAGKLELHLVAAPETATTRAGAESARAEIVEIGKLRKAKDLPAARTRAEALIEHLLEVEGREWSEALARQAWEAGIETDALALLLSTERTWRSVLLHRSRTLPGDHPGLQDVRLNLAVVTYDLGDVASARAQFELVLEVYSRTLPDDHPDLQTTRLNLAATMERLGDLASARALEEKVLEVLSRTLPDDHPDLQRARQGLAVTLAASGELAGARALEQQVFEIRSRTLPDDHPDLQVARANLAATLAELGDLQGARKLCEKVFEVRSRTLPADHPELQAARLNLAGMLAAIGELAGARALQEQVLEVRSRTLPDDHNDLQEAQLGLAGTIKALGDLQGARALEEHVLEVRSRTLPDGHRDLQYARLRLAATIKALGDMHGARALEEKVLEIYGTLPDDQPDLQDARFGLAVTLAALGDLQGARALEEQLLEICTRTLPDDHPGLLTARQNLAATLTALGDLQGARELFEQVFEVCSRTLRDDDPDLRCARHNLAATLLRLGDASHSRPIAEDFRQGLLALVVDALLTSSREAEERVANESKHISLSLSFSDHLGSLGGREELAQDALALVEDARAAGLATAELRTTLRGHPGAQALFDQAAAASVELARSAQSSAGRAAYDAAVRRRDEAQRAILALAGDETSRETLALRGSARALARDLEDGQALVGYWRYERTKWEPVEGETTLAEDATESLLAHVIRPDGSFTRIELGPIAPIADAVSRWRDQLRAPLELPGARLERGVATGAIDEPVRRDLEAGESVRRLVFDPLLPALGDARELVLALDDVLHAVPFDVLPLGEGARRQGGPDSERAAGATGDEALGDRFHIELRLALRKSLPRTRAAEAGDTLLALGAAAFHSEPLPPEAEDTAALEEAEQETRVASLLRGGAWERGFAPLPYTGPEAHGIATLYEEARGADARALVLGQRKASRAAVETLAPRARWLHVATHGWFAPESIRSWADPEAGGEHAGLREGAEERVKGASPMVLCGLALAGANLPADAFGAYPGLVTAEEISGWDLSSCELAVLSACDTNVGERRAGQCVASLQKALHMAGARSVITSLWKVPDEATMELMLDFYRRIWVEKKPKHQALWEAKKKLRDAKDDEGRPLHSTRDWAAWVLTGDPD